MKESRFVTSGIIVLAVLLVIDIGVRIFFNPVEASATGNIEYKSVLIGGTVGSEADLDRVLNNMGSQGWVLG